MKMLIVLLAATATAAVPSQKSLQPAVKKYLREQGDFCLGKFEWPILVSAEDRQGGSRDSLQMPVLEKLGLVTVADAPQDATVKVYSLTPEGKKYYVPKTTITVNGAGQRIKHTGDLCPAKLKLDKVMSWNDPTMVDGKTQTNVKFTYKIAREAQWARDEDVAKVFPMIPQILHSAGSQQLEQVFGWSGREWVAVAP
jgi:hypothetical protein